MPNVTRQIWHFTVKLKLNIFIVIKILLTKMAKAVLCDCDFDEKSDIIGSLCKYCKIIDDKLRENQWYEQIKVIKKYLSTVENTPGSENKIPIIYTLFEYLLTLPIFIAKNTGFRNAIINKIIEFKNYEDVTLLLPVFNKFDIFMEEIKNYPDYC